MTVEEIRQLIISHAVIYSEEHSISAYNAVTTYARYLYSFSTARGLRTPYSSGYRERFYDFVLGDNNALNNSELRYAAAYFAGTRITKKFAAETLKELQKTVSAHRAEVKRLTEATEEIRRDQGSCFPFSIMPRISDYVRYVAEVTDEPNNPFFMYTSLYHIGYVDGIRAERNRRKAKNIPTRGEEVTDVH